MGTRKERSMTAKPFSRFAAALAVAVAAAPAFAGDAVPAAEDDFGRRVVDLAVGLGLAVIALFVSLWLAMKAVEMAIGMFDKVTDDMDEWEELKKGNVAVGILMASVIFAVGNIISDSVAGLTGALMHPDFEFGFVLKIVVALVNLVIGLWIATYVIGLALRILDRMTKNIEEMKEIAKGNVAVALMVAGVLLAVSKVVGAGVSGISRIASVENVAGVAGLHLGK
jgi:uncharacterized membrane protein YjfL (UPF0719 family)